MDIKEYGIRVGKNRVRCRYCNKNVSGNHRLKYHLGNVRKKDVTPCQLVPSVVKEAFRQTVDADMAKIRDKAQRSIARFFYENYLDFSAVDLPINNIW